ncbi:MAG: hypothetical protein JWO53_897 [Chlamydiia bacterium]|nr:hypothetical protein [Chlamydiia bacterium]
MNVHSLYCEYKSDLQECYSMQQEYLQSKKERDKSLKGLDRMVQLDPYDQTLLKAREVATILIEQEYERKVKHNASRLKELRFSLLTPQFAVYSTILAPSIAYIHKIFQRSYYSFLWINGMTSFLFDSTVDTVFQAVDLSEIQAEGVKLSFNTLLRLYPPRGSTVPPSFGETVLDGATSYLLDRTIQYVGSRLINKVAQKIYNLK